MQRSISINMGIFRAGRARTRQRDEGEDQGTEKGEGCIGRKQKTTPPLPAT